MAKYTDEVLKVRKVKQGKGFGIFHPADSRVRTLSVFEAGLVSVNAEVNCDAWAFKFRKQTVVANNRDTRFWVIG